MPAHKLRKGKSKATSPADGADGHTISSSRTQPPRAKASPLARIAPVAIVLFVIIAGFLIMKSRFTPGSVEEFDRLYGKRGAAPGEMQEFAYLRQFLDGLDGHKAQRAVLDKIATLAHGFAETYPHSPYVNSPGNVNWAVSFSLPEFMISDHRIYGAKRAGCLLTLLDESEEFCARLTRKDFAQADAELRRNLLARLEEEKAQEKVRQAEYAKAELIEAKGDHCRKEIVRLRVEVNQWLRNGEISQVRRAVAPLRSHSEVELLECRDWGTRVAEMARIAESATTVLDCGQALLNESFSVPGKLSKPVSIVTISGGTVFGTYKVWDKERLVNVRKRVEIPVKTLSDSVFVTLYRLAAAKSKLARAELMLAHAAMAEGRNKLAQKIGGDLSEESAVFLVSELELLGAE